MQTPTAKLERRSYFRLQYPPFKRPLLIINGVKIEVCELSEGGCKCATGARPPIKLRTPFRANLVFHDNAIVKIIGTAMRMEGEEMVVRFLSGVSFSRMIHEQQNLLARTK